MKNFRKNLKTTQRMIVGTIVYFSCLLNITQIQIKSKANVKKIIAGIAFSKGEYNQVIETTKYPD